MYDVVTVGSATRDVLVKSKHFDVLRDPRFITGVSLSFSLGSKIPIENIFFTTGGAGTNTAVTFGRHGFKVACMVRIGDDPGGGAVRKELISERVHTTLIQNDKQLPTAYSIILEPRGGERTILVYRGANNALSATGLKKVKTHWIYLSSISANLNILSVAINKKKKDGTHIAWNPGSNDLALGLTKLKKYLNYIDVFIVNQEEASKLLGIPYKQERRIFKKFDEIIDGVAVMTMGPKGVVVSDGKTLWRAGIFKEKKIVDRTGAGDAFGSGFVSGLLRKKVLKSKIITEEAIEEALRIGSANATSKVEMVGAKLGLLKKRNLNDKRWRVLKIKRQKL